MTNLENKVPHDHPHLKPKIYVRYVDDCFIVCDQPEPNKSQVILSAIVVIMVLNT